MISQKVQNKRCGIFGKSCMSEWTLLDFRKIQIPKLCTDDLKKMIRNTNDSNKHLVKDLTLHSNPLTNPRYVYFRYAVIKEGLWYTPCEHVTLGWIMWKFSRKVLKIFLEIFMKMLENFQETLVENFHENEKKIFKKIFTWKFSSFS